MSARVGAGSVSKAGTGQLWLYLISNLCTFTFESMFDQLSLSTKRKRNTHL